MPEEVEKIKSLSQHSPDYLNLGIEITNLETDSLLISTYIVNSSNTNDTLYHSSSFPLLIAYDNEGEITPSIEDQIFFDDLNTTVVKPGIKYYFQKNIRIKSLSNTPYSIRVLFRYNEHSYMDGSKKYWLVSEPTQLN